MKRRWSRWSIGLLGISAIAIIACGSDEDAQPAATSIPTSQPAATSGPQPTATPAPLKGTIEIDGSSTVFPISQAVAEEFNKIHRGVQVPVGVSGTGGGFKRFVTGETQISNASRPIKDSEAELAAENGVEFVELTVAFDGLSVLVNPENSFVECLTTDELSLIWEPGSEVNNWNQVRAEWPDEEIDLFGPDTESGTFDYFTDEINGEEGASRPDYTAAVDDNVLVQGIAGEDHSLGYFGYAYYVENTDKLKLVEIDNGSGSGCVAPNTDTIADGSYSPLSRPLFIYVNVDSLERPEMRELIDFYIDSAAVLAAEVGYVALSEAEYDEARELVAR